MFLFFFLFPQIGSALIYLHADKFICHQDLNSSNIVVVWSQQANNGNQLPHLKLVNFDRAVRLTEDEFAQSMDISSDYNAGNAGNPSTRLLVGLDDMEMPVRVNGFMLEAYNFGKLLITLASPLGLHLFKCDSLKEMLSILGSPAIRLPQVNIVWALDKFYDNIQSPKPEMQPLIQFDGEIQSPKSDMEPLIQF